MRNKITKVIQLIHILDSENISTDDKWQYIKAARRERIIDSDEAVDLIDEYGLADED